MKVVLLGKSGMLGSCFLRNLAGSEDFEMYAFDRGDLDICDFGVLTDLFTRISPDFVINCAAYTDVDGAEKEPEKAFEANAEAVGVLARACKAENAVMVHFSTDYVFDGKKQGYDEEDEPSPVNVYGKSKLAGEKLLAENMSEFYLVRSSWLFGPHGRNFVDTVLGLSSSRKVLDVVADQIGSPTYTQDLCDAVIRKFLKPFVTDVEREHELSHLEKLQENVEKLDFGIYHLTNNGVVSWADFAREVFRQAGVSVEVNDISSADSIRPAKRPAFSILNNNKTGKLRSWQDALKAYLALR